MGGCITSQGSVLSFQHANRGVADTCVLQQTAHGEVISSLQTDTYQYPSQIAHGEEKAHPTEIRLAVSAAYNREAMDIMSCLVKLTDMLALLLQWELIEKIPSIILLTLYINRVAGVCCGRCQLTDASSNAEIHKNLCKTWRFSCEASHKASLRYHAAL